MTVAARRRAAACALLFILAVGWDCASAGGAELGKPVTLKVGETAMFDDGKITVKFVSVPEDSRCAKGEQCVWAGNARVVLEVSGPGSAAQTVQLNTSRGIREAEIEGFVVRLDNLTPDRASGQPLRSEDYSAILVVSR
jgi:hypothetical protein